MEKTLSVSTIRAVKFTPFFRRKFRCYHVAVKSDVRMTSSDVTFGKFGWKMRQFRENRSPFPVTSFKLELSFARDAI